jgi:hypothetical protein
MSIVEKPAIKMLYLHQLRNDAHFQYLTEFRDLVTATGAAALKIDTLWPAFMALFTALDEALKKISKSALTEKIHDADKARDSIFAGIVKFNKVILDHHFDPAFHEAASQIEIVLRTYGNVAAKPINEETSAIYNLVQELTSEKYRTFVTLIGLMTWVAKLSDINTQLEGHIKERDRENAPKHHIVMKKARADIDAAYKNIIDTLNSLIFLKLLTNCESFVETLNTVVQRYTVMIKHIHHGGHGSKTHGNGTHGGESAGISTPLNDQDGAGV